MTLGLSKISEVPSVLNIDGYLYNIESNFIVCVNCFVITIVTVHEYDEKVS